MKHPNIKKENLFFTTAILVGVIAIVGLFYYLSLTKEYVSEMQNVEFFVSHDPFKDISLEGQGVYVYDIGEERAIYSQNPGEKLPLASITKVMTALVAIENIPSTESIAILPEDLRTEGESGLIPYENWSVRDLIDFTLIVSSNDAAEALRRAGDSFTSKKGQTFVEAMNAKAKQIGMNQSVFYNPTGLDETSELAGAYSTARDVLKLFDFLFANYPFLIKESALGEKSLTSFSGVNHTAVNTNLLANTLPNLIASKTGFTDLAGGNLAVIVEPIQNHPVIIVVLGSSKDGRFSDVLTLHDRSKSYINAENKISAFRDKVGI